MKILITGGHVTPALAIIDELLKDKHHILFVGRKYAFEHEQTLSLEYKEITKRAIKFVNLTTGRFTRIPSPKTLMSLFKVPLGFYQALQIIKNERPEAVLSFGSYLAVPIVFWAWMFKINVYTHEQTITPGLANKIIAFLAKKIFVAFEETKIHFPKEKVILTGNPVRSSVFKIINEPFKINKNNTPVIYITGGSLGSHSINLHIKQILNKLLDKYILIHQTGETAEYNDFVVLEKVRDSLPERSRANYWLKQHFLEEEIGYVYSVADLVVSRAGANTFFELLALKKPAIFIPLPWSGNKEQQKHAVIFKDNGVGEIFSQSDTSDNLLKLLDKMIANLDHYISNFINLEHLYEANATQIILKEILNQ